MELGFGQSAYATQFDAFVRNYLTMKTGVTPKRDEVYEAFKKHSRNLAGSDGDINAPEHLHKVLGGLRDHAGYYCRIALGRERDATLRDAFADFNELKADTAYPALLEFYNDYEDGVISRDDFVEVIRMLESYVFRRAVCGIPTNSLKLTFQSLAKTIDKSNYLDSLAANLLSLGTYKKFPNDETFAAALHRFDAYNFKRRLYLLRRLENWATKEPAQVGQYTIEHILPQNPDLSPAWRESLGVEWERVQGEWLHSLGNLTLTGYNSEYSDRPFSEKRDIKGGFRDSPLRLNKSLRDLAVWDESAIMDRGTELAQRAVAVWSRPSMPEGVAVDALTSGLEYGVDNFEHLRSQRIREMYDALVRELRALDSTIAIEYRKVHIDFAANGTFMDLVPQAGGLRIQLHVPYEELDDPREICADVSDISRWGTGETRFLLAAYDELPYALGLIRQAFDKQLDVE
ncbi:GmrSD restriction endonuclease domain-containing protein [Rhodococcus erythropolis]